MYFHQITRNEVNASLKAPASVKQQLCGGGGGAEAVAVESEALVVTVTIVV